MKMKKLLALFLSVSIVLSMAACSSSTAASNSEPASTELASNEPASTEPVSTETVPDEISEPDVVTITAYNAEKELIEVEVPYNPQRVAVMDMATLDMMDYWNLGDRVVGMAKKTHVDYLKSYIDNEDIQNLGTLHESDLEAMMAAEPDIIFIGNRMASQYDALSEIAPVVYMALDYEAGLIQCMKNNVGNVAKIFGMEKMAESQIAGFESRIEVLAAAAKDKTAAIGVVTSGGFNTLGNTSRCSLIGREVGFENLANNVDATHGNESSFELLVELNPDYIFVLDRDSAIAAEGAQIASEVMENELVQKTSAYQNNQIVYLTPAPWYLAEGGLTAMDAMLSDLEGAILN